MKVQHVYEVLAGLYPYDYRARFGAEMRKTFQKAEAAERAKGRATVLRFLGRELAGLLLGAGGEWIAKWTTDCWVRGRSLPDVRMMRPAGMPREIWFAEPCS